MPDFAALAKKAKTIKEKNDTIAIVKQTAESKPTPKLTMEEIKKVQEKDKIKNVKKDLVVDAMRGLWWFIYKNSRYKNLDKNQLKNHLNKILHTPEGFGKLLDSLKEYVFK